MSLPDSAVPSLVVTESRLQKHSLQTAQNLLQEEVARAEERSEVRTTSSSPPPRRQAEALISHITVTAAPVHKKPTKRPTRLSEDSRLTRAVSHPPTSDASAEISHSLTSHLPTTCLTAAELFVD